MQNTGDKNNKADEKEHEKKKKKKRPATHTHRKTKYSQGNQQQVDEGQNGGRPEGEGPALDTDGAVEGPAALEEVDGQQHQEDGAHDAHLRMETKAGGGTSRAKRTDAFFQRQLVRPALTIFSCGAGGEDLKCTEYRK